VTITAVPAVQAFQGRIANCIAALHLMEAKSPAVRAQCGEIINELQRLHRDVAGLPPAQPYVAADHAPGPRSMGPRRPCPSHNGGAGAAVSASRFRPGKDMCRECERRAVKIEADRITLELLRGDACIGEPCSRCSEPLEAGQRVAGGALRHEQCPS
jgi:hypothetical protein